MGGASRVESEPAAAARFRFTARFGSADARARPADRLPAELRGAARARGGRQRDEPAHPGGGPHAVAHAADGGVERGGPPSRRCEAAERAKRPFRLVLLDASMPGMDGFELAARIQQSPRLAAASIMMLTSGAGPATGPMLASSGYAAYLTKPVKQSDLLDTIAGRPRLPPSGAKKRRAGRARRGPRRPPGVSASSSPRTTPSTSRWRWACSSKRGHRSVVAANGREVLALPRAGGLRRRADGRADAGDGRVRGDGGDPRARAAGRPATSPSSP